MASLTISEVDDAMVSRLRFRADSHGRSMEEEVKAILQSILGSTARNSGQHLLDTIRTEFGPLGGVELDLPPREKMREPPRFEDW